MKVTESGIEMEAKEEQEEKAKFPIVEIESGIEMKERVVQEKKHNHQ